MIVNKVTVFIVMLIAVIIFCMMSLFYMKVLCTGMYESYVDTSKQIDPVLNESDLPSKYRNISCARMTPEEYWLKLTIAPELKQKLIIDFKDQKDLSYDNFSAADIASRNTGVVGLNRFTLINWATASSN